jgi:hypothetical protein
MFEKIFFKNNREIYRYFSQILWVGISFLVFSFSLISFNYQKLFYFWLKLSLIGSFLFLLIFEGGSSRYLIQFFPFLLMCAALGGEWLFFSKNNKK